MKTCVNQRLPVDLGVAMCVLELLSMMRPHLPAFHTPWEVGGEDREYRCMQCVHVRIVASFPGPVQAYLKYRSPFKKSLHFNEIVDIFKDKKHQI